MFLSTMELRNDLEDCRCPIIKDNMRQRDDDGGSGSSATLQLKAVPLPAGGRLAQVPSHSSDSGVSQISTVTDLPNPKQLFQPLLIYTPY